MEELEQLLPSYIEHHRQRMSVIAEGDCDGVGNHDTDHIVGACSFNCLDR
jgi:hypothetical protein